MKLTIRIQHYLVDNGDTQTKYRYRKRVRDIEKEREILEEKHQCFKKTLLGETEQISSIIFTFRKTDKQYAKPTHRPPPPLEQSGTNKQATPRPESTQSVLPENALAQLQKAAKSPDY